MSDEIRIELVADANGVVKAVQKVVPASKKAGKAAAKKIQEPMLKASTAIKGAFVGLGAAIGVAMGAKKFIEAAAKQDSAVQKLNASLRNMGQFSNETSQSLQDFASQLQSQSTIGDEVVLDQLAFAQAMGASVDESKQILSAAADMSSALGIDLNSAVRNISKTLGGYAGELGEVIPELKGLTKEQLQNGEGIELLAGKYKGFAQSEVKTFNGAMTQLQNTLGDAAEKLGESVVKSPVVIKALNLISKTISEVFGKFPVEDLIKDLNGFIIGLANTADSLTFLLQPIVAIGRTFSTIFSAVKLGFAVVINNMAQSLNMFVQSLPNFAKKFLPAEEIAMAAEATRETVDGFVSETGEKFNTLLENDTSFSDSIRNRVTEFASALQNTTEVVAKNVDKQVKKAKVSALEFKATFEKVSVDVGKQIQQTFVKMMSAGIQHFTKGLMAGKLSMGDFAKSMAGMLGDMAIQIGETLMLAGTGMKALLSLSGGAALAAGAGLIALGTILKSFAGGASPEGATSIPPATAAFDDATNVVGPLDDAIAEDEPGAIERQQTVSLTVQGSIFNTEETGKALIDILNDEFDQQGGRISYA